jgi:hypothetical protein
MEDVERAEMIGVLAGVVFLFALTFVVIALVRFLRRATELPLLAGMVGLLALVFAYLFYTYVASSVQQAFLLRSVETGFVCTLPGVIARFVAPGVAIAAALALHFARKRRSPIASALLLVLFLAACSAHTLRERASEPSLQLLSASDRSICWAGMCIGNTRAEIEAALRIRLRPKEDYSDACGEFYAHPWIAGRRVMLQFSSPLPDGELEVIGVSFSPAERVLTEQQLSRAAREAIPQLIDGTAIEYGTPESPDPLYLALASNHGVAVNIKPDAREKMFYVTDAGCVD